MKPPAVTAVRLYQKRTWERWADKIWADKIYFEGIAWINRETVNLSSPEARPERHRAAAVTTNTFGLLRVQPILGRDFHAEDGLASAEHVAIIGHAIWRTRFESNLDVIGNDIRVNGIPHTIIGIMPEGFHFPSEQDLWTPLAIGPHDLRRGVGNREPVFGRLKPDVTLDEAAVELSGIAGRLARAYPETNRWFDGAAVWPYTEFYFEAEIARVLHLMSHSTPLPSRAVPPRPPPVPGGPAPHAYLSRRSSGL